MQQEAQQQTGENTYRLVTALFMRLLAVVYFIAFASLSVQIVGLAGVDGILPADILLENAATLHGGSRFLAYPTLFWINAGDTALVAATWLGCAFSVFAFLNLRPRFCMAVIYLLYLSLYHAGQTFMNFQWDYVLLEAGFLAIFLRPDSRIVIWLYRWLLFRLRFLSGLSKLISQDVTWASMSALTFYFETQPLPHAGAWYAHHLPLWVLSLGAALVLIIELAVPFMMFMKREYRFIAAWLTLGLQFLILATSNHNWFNILTIILCLFLFDDRALRRVLPSRVCNLLAAHPGVRTAGHLEVNITRVVAAFIVVISLIQATEMIINRPLGGLPGTAADYAHRWVLGSRYHVFPVIEQRRIELVIEGTVDGVHWEPYRFKYKPGAVDRPPAFVVPHQPRLDWMMWFVPINPGAFMNWFENFLFTLMTSSESVTDMLEHNPFADRPPVALRVRTYEYRFTTPEERKRSGHWWKRRYLGLFEPLPGMNREDLQRRFY